MTYTVKAEEKEAEIQWLRDQKIFPGYSEFYDWKEHRNMIRFGVIVSPESALSIKLRHKLDTQDTYRQR